MIGLPCGSLRELHRQSLARERQDLVAQLLELRRSLAGPIVSRCVEAATVQLQKGWLAEVVQTRIAEIDAELSEGA